MGDAAGGGDEAKAIIAVALNDLGALFVSNANVDILITDDDTGSPDSVARASSERGSWESISGKAGFYWASSTWTKIQGMGDVNGGTEDGIIAFNLDIFQHYGSYNAWLSDLRHTTIHEMMHVLGMVSTFEHGSQNTWVFSAVYNAFMIDSGGASLLGTFDSNSYQFYLLDYSHGPLNGVDASGVRFLGKWADGSDRPMELRTWSNWIDFQHVEEASHRDYSADGMDPNEDNVTFLRGMGYEIKNGVIPMYRPDVKVGKNPASLTGHNRFSDSPGSQSVSVSGRRGTAQCFFEVENDRVQTQDITVTGTPGGRKISLTYLHDSGNVTAAMVTAGHVSSCDYRDTESYRVVAKLSRKKVKKRKRTRRGKVKKVKEFAVKKGSINVVVRARGSFDDSEDVAMGRLKMKR